jgi:glycosyltransferase involved in cell wall biosynthesis
VQADISVIIPTYNNAAYLPAAVASVRAQAMAVREIIIVDDGSQDGTEAVIPTLGEVRYLRQANAGPAAARNRGLAMAEGEWVAFLDADDTWTPDRLSDQWTNLERHPELVLEASDMAEVDTNGRVLVPSVLARHGLLAAFTSLDGEAVPRATRRLLEKNFIPTGTVLARRAVLRAAGGFPDRLRWGEDLALWARVAALGPIACLPRVHMLRLQHGGNATGATQAMLASLVDVAGGVREWGRELLWQQGIDVDRLVAQACNDLGYYHFDRGEYAAARQAFERSLGESPTRRAFLYRLALALPPDWLRRLRSGWQQRSHA